MIGCSTYGQEFVGVWWLSDRVQYLRARVWGMCGGLVIGCSTYRQEFLVCGGLVIGCSTYGQEFVGVRWLSDRVQYLRARVCGCAVA